MQPRAVLAIDIGGTKIAAAIVELYGESEGCKPSTTRGSELPHGGSTRASAVEFSGNEIMPENYLAPANVFAPHEEAPTSVSNLQLGLVSEVGLEGYKVACRMQVATDAARGGAAVLASVCSLARDVKAQYEALPSALSIVACGVGTAGNVDKTTGAIASANSLMPGWGGQPLRAALEAACGVPCAVLNDVQAHAMGELAFGAARGTKDAIMVAVGTGIGGAIVADGQVVLGARGFAGALGTTPCAVAARMDESGAYANNGSIEAVASGSGIEAVFAALTGRQLSGREIAICAQTDEDARKAIRLAGTTLGEAIATWVKLLDPAVVVLGGSVVGAGELWRESVMAAYATNMAPAQGDSGSAFSALIKFGELGGDAPLVGAAAFALSKL